VIIKRLGFLILLFPLTLSSCGPRPQDCARPGVFCAGLVTASGSIDTGINEEAWLGLQDAKTKGGIDRIDYIETVDPRDRARNISTFAQDGYGLIITVGDSFSDDTLSAAQEYPKIKFIGVQQSQAIKVPNLAGLVFHEDQSGFRAGALAALITRTDHVAAVCEKRIIDSVRRYCDGFQAGVHYVSSAVLVSLIYREGPPQDLSPDPIWGGTTALQAVQDGADVLFAAGGTTADAALGAAASRGAYVIGSETDPYSRLTDIDPQLVSSAVSEIPSALEELVRMAQAGEFPSGNFFGQTDLAPLRNLEPQITPGILKRLEVIRLGLVAGSIRTEIPFQNP
jgi:basic membrane protein A and related proteins